MLLQNRKIMKVYAYLRVSTEKQDFQQQLNAINNYLKTKNLEIDSYVEDEGVSGGVSYKDRNLYSLIKKMEQGDVLVVSEISRLGRSMSDLNKLVNDEMKPRGLRLIVVGMGLDINCSNLKAIDEMILFAFSFASQIEKEMIQERTKNALEARKRQIEANGYYISKSGAKRTKLGGGAMSEAAREKAAVTAMKKAAENENNAFFRDYIKVFEMRMGKLTNDAPRAYFEQIAKELTAMGRKTQTGLEYTATRVRALWVRMKNREMALD